MSWSATPYENACAEMFFKTIKVECLNQRHFTTRQQAQDAVMTYALFYSRIRIHQSLGYMTSITYEATFAT